MNYCWHMLYIYLDLEAAKFPYDCRSRDDKIHKLFVKSIHIFIISTHCHVFISVFVVSVQDLLHPNLLLVWISRDRFGYVSPVNHVLSTADLKVLHTQSPILPGYVISLLCDLQHRVIVLFRYSAYELVDNIASNLFLFLYFRYV
jgi:hypothetical protein